MGLRTIHLKLHKPGTSKKNIINNAFINYNNAYNYLLAKARADIENIEINYRSQRGTYSTLGLSKWIDSNISAEINKFDIQPFKDSLKFDFGMTLASYFMQKKNNPHMPFPPYKKEPVNAEDKLRPIYFCRYDTKRSFCLLYDKEANKFFAKLFLMNIRNGKKRESFIFKRTLTCLSKMEEGAKALQKETFIIAPLSFGKWQLSMLQQAVERPEILRTARLINKNNEFFLSISIDLPEEDKVETSTYMGLCRGIETALNYTIIDNKANPVTTGSMDFNIKGNSSEQKQDIHKLTNKIIEIALKNKSMVVLQNLTGKGDKLSWIEDGVTQKPTFGCKRYNDLARILEYKLPQKGLPGPAIVSSVDIFHRCSICGSNTRKNRFSKTMFICTTCGLSSGLDSLGSYNLAAKLIKYRNEPVKLRGRRTPEGLYLKNELIGLELFVERNENPLERLKEEIQNISEYVEDYANAMNLNTNEVRSIIEKLRKNNFTNIEIV